MNGFDLPSGTAAALDCRFAVDLDACQHNELKLATLLYSTLANNDSGTVKSRQPFRCVRQPSQIGN